MRKNTVKGRPDAVAAYNSILHVRISDYLREELKSCGKGELVPSYGSVLAVVYRNNGKVQIKDIYDALSKQKSTITESINRLVQLGYLEKEISPEDARCTYVKATEKADAMHDDFLRISKELEEQIFQDFTKEEKQVFADLLLRAMNNFR